jgi:hypothetical protein
VAAKWLTLRKGFWLSAGALLALALIIGVLYAVHAVKRLQRREGHRIYFKWIGTSLLTFADANGRLAPAVRKDKDGRPLSSWRFQILPFIQSWMGVPWMEFGEPWDSPANEYWAHLHNRIYCWSSKEGSPDQFHTNVVAITGPGTPFEEGRQIRTQDLPGSTILVVEIAHSGIHWAAPGDLSLDNVPVSLVQGVEGDGFHVYFADGQTWFLSADVPLEDVKKFFTIAGAKEHDREQLLGRYALSRS